MIRVEHLSYRYPDGTLALIDVSLHFAAGEFVLICGANGSGKTTLIRHLNGVLSPTSGKVYIKGLSTTEHPREVRRQVGMVFQDADTQLIAETVGEDVAFGAENLGLSGAELNERVDSALAAMNLRQLADKPCRRLSGGEKRRLAIAGLLAVQPHTLVFDEPFSNLDYPGLQDVLRQLITLHRSGHTLIVSSHDVEKVICHVDRVVLLDHGRVAADSPPALILPLLAEHGVRPPCGYLAGIEMQPWLSG